MDGVRILTVPSRLRLGASLIFLCIPLFVLEEVLIHSVTRWTVPYARLNWQLWVIVPTTFIFYYQITQFSLRSLRLLRLLFVFWSGYSFWKTCELGYPGMGFFSVSLTLFLLLNYLWLRFELSFSYSSLVLPWYQERFLAIPQVRCVINSGGKKSPFLVCRIDAAGMAGYLNSEQIAAHKNKLIGLELTFLHHRLDLSGKVLVTAREGQFLGIEFEVSSGDLRKKIADFNEAITVRGYLEGVS